MRCCNCGSVWIHAGLEQHGQFLVEPLLPRVVRGALIARGPALLELLQHTTCGRQHGGGSTGGALFSLDPYGHGGR
jgi:hypothetical protein